MALLFQCSFWKLPILSLLFLIYLVPSVFLIPVSSFCIHVFSPQFFFAASSSFLFLSVLVLLPFPIVSWLFFTCDLLSSVPCWLFYPQFVYLSIYLYVSVSCFLMFLLPCFWFWTQLLKFIFAGLVCHLCPCLSNLYTPPFITHALLCWWWLNIMDTNWAVFKHVYSFQS